jgi:DNA invertase Pin-like site-specific DNA recombinase
MNTAFVSYRRVSSVAQSESGLGLEAQSAAIAQYVAGKGSVIAEFVEVESGTNNARPELAKAIAVAKARKAVLVIARLDRLARNVHFVSGLAEAKVEFVACDNPAATTLTINILAAVAQEEARLISVRTKAALQAARERGTVLGGSYRFSAQDALKGAAKGGAVNAQAKRAAYASILPQVRSLRAAGESLTAIARKLNDAGEVTRTGAAFTAKTVERILAVAA